MAELDCVDWQIRDGAGYLTLKRPPLNVLNISMLRQIEEVLKEAGQLETLRVLVLRAEGKLFSAGVDVGDHTAEKVGEMIPLFDRVCRSLSQLSCATLAAVHGHALGGGCELALSCDLVLASENANFGQPEIKLATLAPVAAERLPALVGYRRAAYLLFTGEAVSATEAARWGLINQAIPLSDFKSTVEQCVDRLTRLSAAALRLCKEALLLGTSEAGSLPSIEQLYLKKLMTTADAHEGLGAFLEKRTPVWKHH